MLAGMRFGIPTVGTMAHSFVTSFVTMDELLSPMIKARACVHRGASCGRRRSARPARAQTVNVVEAALRMRHEMGAESANISELAAFISYAQVCACVCARVCVCVCVCVCVGVILRAHLFRFFTRYVCGVVPNIASRARQSHPDSFLALVDTYDTLTSGVPNFCAVAVCLFRAGYKVRRRPMAAHEG